jgi:Protein kinase domain
MGNSPRTALGPYELGPPLGAGGMGEVYRATDTRLSRTVAIKVLPQELVTNESRRQRFEREARAVSALSHPNICALYDIGEQAGVPFLVMEFVDGERPRLAAGARSDSAASFAVSPDGKYVALVASTPEDGRYSQLFGSGGPRAVAVRAAAGVLALQHDAVIRGRARHALSGD